MKRRSIESEKQNQVEYTVDDIDTESDKDEDRVYSVDYIDTESGEDATKIKDKDSDIEYSDDDADNGEEDDSGNVDSDNISSETDKDSDSSGGGIANLESKVTLGDMIADLDNCEAGTMFLNILEMYMVFIVTLYVFVLICS
jgi:hypothetical protein